MTQELRLERLIGRVLTDAAGRTVGRVQDVVAEPDGDEYLVTHLVVGPNGRIARLLAFGHQIPVLQAVGLGRPPRVRRIPWGWLDLADAEHPRLLKSVID
jgi:sporulation protein YlmC with PRC-barrel domain